MDPLSRFIDRFDRGRLALALLFGLGLAVAVWDPKTKVILTLALGISGGMLILGPYSAAVLYTRRLQVWFGGRLRWPVSLLLSLSAVYLADYFLVWTPAQLAMAAATASVGTIVGHDATLALLELRAVPQVRIDGWMVFLFPFAVSLAALAGYCSLGFGIGTYHLISGLIG
jgi:hypothetical protein